MWKGSICFADVRVSVKVYAAAEDRKVHFRLLHAKDLVPVKQRMVDTEQGEPVTAEEIQRGMEAEPGIFVLLPANELTALEPAPSRNIEVTRFVPAQRLAHALLERPYFLGPDDDTAGYAALAEALGKQRRFGLAHWVMRKKSYVGALIARGPHLALMTLRHAEEVVALPTIRHPKGYAPERREVALAEQLIAALADGFDPSAYHDAYRERVRTMLELKARGEDAPKEHLEKNPPVRALGDALRESVRVAQEKRSA